MHKFFGKLRIRITSSTDSVVVVQGSRVCNVFEEPQPELTSHRFEAAPQGLITSPEAPWLRHAHPRSWRSLPQSIRRWKMCLETARSPPPPAPCRRTGGTPLHCQARSPCHPSSRRMWPPPDSSACLRPQFDAEPSLATFGTFPSLVVNFGCG